MAKNSSLQPIQYTYNLSDSPVFSTSYQGAAPLPVVAAYRDEVLHRFTLKREEWDYDRLLAEKKSALYRSDSSEGSQTDKSHWNDLIFADSDRVFYHIDGGRLSVYHYDAESARSKAFAFRKAYAVPRSGNAGRYYLLTSSDDGIDTEHVALLGETNLSSEDLHLFYGDDFEDWMAEFLGLVSSKTSGLSIFEGPPGTGKTSFLRHLMGRLKESHRFYFIPPAATSVLSNPQFIPFWARQRAAFPERQFVCVLEDADGVLMIRDSDNRREVGAILNITDGLMADFLRLQVICSINCRSTDIDPALVRPGRLMAHRVFQRLGPAQAQALARAKGLELAFQTDYSLAEIFNPTAKVASKRAIGFAA
jgi:hypothetical protein